MAALLRFQGLIDLVRHQCALRRATMDQYSAYVSLKETGISMRENGKRIWRGKCLQIRGWLRNSSDSTRRTRRCGIREAPSTWFHHELTACRRCASMHAMPRRRLTRDAEQDRRQSCRRPVPARGGRILPGGAGQVVRGHRCLRWWAARPAPESRANSPIRSAV